jgi:hypothetical protein
MMVDFESQSFTLLFMGTCMFVTSGLAFDVDGYFLGSPDCSQALCRCN